jgi:hypothetical protein
MRGLRCAARPRGRCGWSWSDPVASPIEQSRLRTPQNSDARCRWPRVSLCSTESYSSSQSGSSAVAESIQFPHPAKPEPNRSERLSFWWSRKVVGNEDLEPLGRSSQCLLLAGSRPSLTRRQGCSEILHPSQRSHDPRQPDSTLCRRNQSVRLAVYFFQHPVAAVRSRRPDSRAFV